LCFGFVVLMAGLLLFGCAAAEPRPSGVSWRTTFFVLPVYPKSFEITAVGPRSLSQEKLKEAWQKKAKLVASGRRFKTGPLVVHENETVPYGSWPMQSRSVTGTITLIE
jgi:hypothetical protein